MPYNLLGNNYGLAGLGGLQRAQRKMNAYSQNGGLGGLQTNYGMNWKPNGMPSFSQPSSSTNSQPSVWQAGLASLQNSPAGNGAAPTPLPSDLQPGYMGMGVNPAELPPAVNPVGNGAGLASLQDPTLNPTIPVTAPPPNMTIQNEAKGPAGTPNVNPSAWDQIQALQNKPVWLQNELDRGYQPPTLSELERYGLQAGERISPQAFAQFLGTPAGQAIANQGFSGFGLYSNPQAFLASDPNIQARMINYFYGAMPNSNPLVANLLQQSQAMTPEDMLWRAQQDISANDTANTAGNTVAGDFNSQVQALNDQMRAGTIRPDDYTRQLTALQQAFMSGNIGAQQAQVQSGRNLDAEQQQRRDAWLQAMAKKYGG